MEHQRRNVLPVVLVLILSFAIICMSACGVADISGFVSTTQPTVDTQIGGGETTPEKEEIVTPHVKDIAIQDGSVLVTMSDGTVKNVGSVNTYVTENNVTVNGADQSANVQHVAKTLLSTVAVECGFTFVQNGYFQQTYTQYGSGAGVIYQLDKATGDAYIITNYHVVYQSNSADPNGISQKIGVYMLGDISTIPATYIGGSPKYDIAVLRVEDSARLATSAAQAADLCDRYVTAGEDVIVVGNANGDGISVTEGIVSVDSEQIVMKTILDESQTDSMRVIRVDAPVNPGNSGGGLYNANAELLGIVNAKLVDEDTEGMGYAIPADIAVTIADKVIEGDVDDTLHARRVVVGVMLTIKEARLVYDPLTGLVRIEETVVIPEDAAATLTSGAIDGVVEGGLGEQAGLQCGDIIVGIKVGEREAVSVTRQFEVIDAVLKAREGDTIVFDVLRGEETLTLSVTVPENYHD